MRLVPQQRARQMLYTCELAPASELAAYGTVLKVVPLDELRRPGVGDRPRDRVEESRRDASGKRSVIGIDPVDVSRSYRYEQGFTYELNLWGVGDEPERSVSPR